MNDLTPAQPPLLKDFFAGRKPTTLRTYHQGLADFAQFVGGTVNEAAGALIALSPGDANHLALSYRADMVQRDLAAHTINSRLSALRSLVKLARTLGLIAWTLEVRNVKARPYRDTRGPGTDGYRTLLATLAQDQRPKAIRDTAILRLLFDRALRRSEVIKLDLEHVDLAESRLAVWGKGHNDLEWLTIAEPTKRAISAWLAVRGTDPGPLFTNPSGGRLSGEAIRQITVGLSAKTKLHVRPHGLRHAGITRALDVCNGDVRKVQKFSRHASPNTVMVYDDNRQDVGGEITRKVAQEDLL